MERAVRQLGFRLPENPAGDEYAIFVHPQTGQVVPVNRDWPAIYADDPTFECIRRDLGVSSARFLELLSQH